MISTLKEVREALNLATTPLARDRQEVLQAITKLDALIAVHEKDEPQYLSIERVEGFPEKLEQGPQPLLYSDGINGCMVRRDDVWLALTSQLAMPQTAPSTSQLTEKMISDAARMLSDRHAAACNVDCGDVWKMYSGDFIEDAKAALQAAHGIGAKP